MGTPTPYLTRLFLLHTPWFSVMMHWLKPDPQPDMHDHPVTFLSLILRGFYVEQIATGGLQKCRWWNFKRATDAHRIVWTAPNTLTLVITGPRRREWGFITPKGWVPWRMYD